MENKKEIRWKQRFVNFEKAYNLLKRAIAIEAPSEAEKGGIIQFYEVCFELSWKTMKDYLESEGFIVKTPRETIKQAFQVGIIDSGELWLSALQDRNITSHIYDETITDEIVQKIKNLYFKQIEKLYNFFKKEYEQ